MYIYIYIYQGFTEFSCSIFVFYFSLHYLFYSNLGLGGGALQNINVIFILLNRGAKTFSPRVLVI